MLELTSVPMTDLEKAKQINERIGLRADGRISVWCAGAWESSMLIANLQSRIEDLERCLDKQDQSISMSELSLQAQEVFWAFNRAASGKPYDWHYLPAIAAALRAAADQVTPKEWPTIEDYNEYEQGVAAAHIKYRNQILAIADELEAQ